MQAPSLASEQLLHTPKLFLRVAYPSARRKTSMKDRVLPVGAFLDFVVSRVMLPRHQKRVRDG